MWCLFNDDRPSITNGIRWPLKEIRCRCRYECVTNRHVDWKEEEKKEEDTKNLDPDSVLSPEKSLDRATATSAKQC